MSMHRSIQLRQLSSLTQIASVRAFRSAPAHERARSQQYPGAHAALVVQAQKPLRKPLSLVHAIHQQPLIAPQHSTAGSSDTETIAAVVTGAQQGSVAIIRLSGPDAVQIALTVFKPSSHESGWSPKTHRIYHGHVLNPEGGIIDEVLLLSMLAPRSYTSEDVIELHCHGGGVCVDRVLRCCLQAGARLAKPGEFTLRAFLNGRLDLSQAESVNQLVSARTAAAADSAVAGLTGGIGAMVQNLRRSALRLLAELEAMIDFEEDVPLSDAQRLQHQVQDIAKGLQQALDTASKGRLLKSGLQVALVGRPNVGKSSLLNAWSGTDKAIVTQVAGTTRDIVQADVVVGGVPVSLLDTAGIREASDIVERLGVERSRAAAAAADIAIMVLDAQVGWTAEDQVIFDHLWGRAVPGNKPAVKAPAIVVWNKVDLVAHPPAESQHTSQLQQPSSASQSASLYAINNGNSDLPSQPAQPARGNMQSGATAQQQSVDGHESSLEQASTAAGSQDLSVQCQVPAVVQTSAGSPPDQQTARQWQPVLPMASTADSRHSKTSIGATCCESDESPRLGQAGTDVAAGAGAGAVTDGVAQASTQFRAESSPSLRMLTKSSPSSSLHEHEPARHTYSLPSSCADSFAACVETCATSGLGLDALSAVLLELSNAPNLAAGGVGWAVNNRQAEALIRAQEALVAVADSIHGDLPIDFWTIDLRSAVSALGEVSGDDVTEEVLDSVFSQFCIGK